jgi:signal transduction histidine kinase
MFTVASSQALRAAADALDTGQLQAYDFALDLPGGRRELEARVSPSGPNEVTAIVRDFTDVRAVEAEVRRSRARIVEATDEERRRLERDLHDGAQQRLVSVSLALRRLQGRLAAQAGLGPAITALAERSPVPATVRSVPDRRLPPAVEATAYFVVSEALANIAKHAVATNVSIAATASPSTLRIEVGDNGVGGADATHGSGIRGLQDRVAAIGGTLAIESPTGQGTLAIAVIPIA